MTVGGVLRDILERAGPGQALVRLVVIDTQGSAPREVGAAMVVDAEAATGTIGGGQLEYEAIAHARELLRRGARDPTPWLRETRVWPLGPALGQCCGGTVRLLFEYFGADEIEHVTALGDVHSDGVFVRPLASGERLATVATPSDTHVLPAAVSTIVNDMVDGRRALAPTLIRAGDGGAAHFIEPLEACARPLFIYGAGHVGRAIVKIATDLDVEIYWVDTHAERFPEQAYANVHEVVARDPAMVADAAPAGALHVVLTYSHAMDLAICHALLLQSEFAFLGLIGSATKRARFQKRLREGGVAAAALQRLTCPIGTGGLRGKEPVTIAVSVVAQLIERLEALRDKGPTTAEGGHGTSQRIPA